jgi:hypothetical protein
VGVGPRCAQEERAHRVTLGSVAGILFCMKHSALHISSLSPYHQPWNMTTGTRAIDPFRPRYRGYIQEKGLYLISFTSALSLLFLPFPLFVSLISFNSTPPSLFFSFCVSFTFYSSSSECVPSSYTSSTHFPYVFLLLYLAALHYLFSFLSCIQDLLEANIETQKDGSNSGELNHR